MKQNENHHNALNIQVFLAATREYFALSNTRQTVRLPPTVSTATTKPPRTTMNAYRKIAKSFLLAAGLGALIAAPAMAQPDCGAMGNHRERHSAMKEQHQKQLHEALKLTPEQEPAWNKLLETEQRKPNLGNGQADDWSTLKAPERAEKMLELSKARQARMTDHVAALKNLYAALSPEQQKVFDDFHNGPRHGMGGRPGTKAPNADKAPAKP